MTWKQKKQINWKKNVCLRDRNEEISINSASNIVHSTHTKAKWKAIFMSNKTFNFLKKWKTQEFKIPLRQKIENNFQFEVCDEWAFHVNFSVSLLSYTYHDVSVPFSFNLFHFVKLQTEQFVIEWNNLKELTSCAV